MRLPRKPRLLAPKTVKIDTRVTVMTVTATEIVAAIGTEGTEIEAGTD
jgi:hypothetical protein